MSVILAIDSGLTMTKAVLFETDGRTRGVARRQVAQLIPAPHHVERDMDGLWQATAEAIREVLAHTGTAPTEVVAVAATAHGDGLYLLDDGGAPLGPAILSLDSRASAVVDGWEASGLAAESLALTGQAPHVSAPSALLAWLRDNDPDRFARIGHVLACKDWLRYCLTGTIGTDRTEASTSFTDVTTQAYSPGALALFGLEALAPALPEVAEPAAIVGHVTAEAAARTGLAVGTPVAAGLHDVTASALGIGGHAPGVVAVIAGTYSINECLSDRPLTDPRWFCRNAIAPGLWNAMSISPASTTNYEWFLTTFCAADRALAEAGGGTIHDVLAPELARALARPSPVLYHPFLFGAPHGPVASAGFFGLRGWHDRGDVLAALLEGIAFNHRAHVEALSEGFGPKAARLTGGASRNPVVAQLFADVLGLPVTMPATEEAAAWGAALCAGAAVGCFARFDADPRDTGADVTYLPDPGRRRHYDQRYKVWREMEARMQAAWPALNALGQTEREIAP